MRAPPAPGRRPARRAAPPALAAPLALAAALALACGEPPRGRAARSAPAAPRAEAAAPARRPPPGEPSAGEQAEAEALVGAMLARVTRARQLGAREGVRARPLGRKNLIDQVRARAASDLPPEVVRAQGELLIAFGLIPPEYDYEAGVYELLEAQLAGYYEPADKTMYLAADLEGDDADATLAHELVHALQDQHFDLAPRLAFRDDGGDPSAATQSLAEGDAMSAMFDVLLGGRATALDLPENVLALQMRASQMLMPRAQSVPSILRASLVAPYLDGLLFVNALRRRGGWAAVDRAWRRPPATTEQLLHPDKYERDERPKPVPPAPVDALGGGFRALYTDTQGEQALRLMFEEWGPLDKATSAAAGWGGDRVSLLVRQREGNEERFGVWWVRFDETTPACGEAVEAFRFATRAFSPQASHSDTTFRCRERPDLGPFAVARNACDIVFLAGPFARSPRPHASGVGCADLREWATKRLAENERRPPRR
ncbi:MAG TPA: hypothetical protein VFS43_05315 [Polyangiaceae bacterium]|nr:hypothetical protein [Polyangiaceae bacterium]